MGDNLTENDIKKIQEEINYRKLVVRPEAIEAVKEARAQGDLSENFEYYAAKKYKNQNESRIRYLERMIKTAIVISDESEADEVGMNDLITVYFEEDDLEEKYKIVTTVRSNSLANLISIESPLGKALMGLADKICEVKKIPSIRVDTHEDNIGMQKLLEKCGFEKCGIIHLENGDPRVAYEKVL